MGWGHPASNHALPWLFLCSSASGVISFSSAPWQNPQAMFAGLAFGGTASDISPGHTPSPRAQGQRMLLPAARRGCLQPDFALCQHQCSLWELNLQNGELLLATAKCLKGPFLFSIGFSCGSRLCILFQHRVGIRHNFSSFCCHSWLSKVCVWLHTRLSPPPPHHES